MRLKLSRTGAEEESQRDSATKPRVAGNELSMNSKRVSPWKSTRAFSSSWKAHSSQPSAAGLNPFGIENQCNLQNPPALSHGACATPGKNRGYHRASLM